MYTRTLSSRKAKKYAHLELHAESDKLDDVRALKPAIGAGAKGARSRTGRLNTAELGGVYKGNSDTVVYTTANGAVSELNVRGLEEKTYRDQMIEKAQKKEAVKFRIAVIKHKSGRVFFNKLDNMMIKRIAEMLCKEDVPQHMLMASMPYDNVNYVEAYQTWAYLVMGMQFKKQD